METWIALDWDRKTRDYIPCSPQSTVRMVRLIGLVTTDVPLCDNHRRMFEEEMAKFGGHLDKVIRVKIL